MMDGGVPDTAAVANTGVRRKENIRQSSGGAETRVQIMLLATAYIRSKGLGPVPGDGHSTGRGRTRSLELYCSLCNLL